MAKSTKKLANQIKVDDTILLDRPEVKILEITDAKKKFRQSPKDAKVFKIEDKSTGKIDEVFVLDDDKIDLIKRPSWWDNMKKKFDNNHKSYQAKVKTSKDLLHPLFKGKDK